MPAEAPELHEKRDGQREIVKRINWLLRHQGNTGASLVFVNGISTGSIQLSTLNSVSLSPGSIVYVDSVGDYFGLKLPTAVIAADGITRVDAFGKAGYQWERMGIANLDWQARLTWSVSSTGSDEASGVDDAHALATLSEVARRIHGAVYATGTSCVVRILDSLATTDAPFFDVRGIGTPGGTAVTPIGTNCFLTVVGVPTVVYTGTIATPSQAAAGTVADNHFTDASAPAFATTARVWHRTTGTGGYFWPSVDQGGGTFRISQVLGTANNVRTMTGGDAWQILSLPTIRRIGFPATRDPLQYQIALCYVNPTAAAISSPTSVRYSVVQFSSTADGILGDIKNCRDFHITNSSTPPVGSVIVSGLISAAPASKLTLGSEFVGRLLGGASDYVTFQGIPLNFDHDCMCDEGAVMFYDLAAPCIAVNGPGNSVAITSVGGSGNSDDIINVSFSDNRVCYTAAPPAGMTSKGSPITVTGVSATVASLPNNDLSKNAFVMADA